MRSRLWIGAWNGLAPFDRSAEPILRYLVEQGFLDQDGELLFVGPSAEQRFGHRHFMGNMDQRALAGLKFNEALPERRATATLAARLADVDSAVRVLAESVRFSVLDG